MLSWLRPATRTRARARVRAGVEARIRVIKVRVTVMALVMNGRATTTNYIMTIRYQGTVDLLNQG